MAAARLPIGTNPNYNSGEIVEIASQMTQAGKRKRTLAVSSGGGHWEQLVLLSPSLSGTQTRFATTIPGLPEKSGIADCVIVSDCNRSRPLAAIRCVLQAVAIIASYRPHLVVSTGAAPGLIFLAVAKVFGARTMWIDSVANGEKLSMSGKFAGRFCDVQITQWSHLATPGGPRYLGSVL